jgi:Derlin-2/3
MDFAGAGFAGANGGAGGAAAGAGVDLMSWYMEIPVISRIYLTGAFLTTAMCALDIISPFYLYFNWDLVVSHGQLWRLVTSYLFFGLFSIDYLFHMYFLVRAFRAAWPLP